MSAKTRPSFTVDGTTYEFVFSRSMQVKYQEMTEEKRNDKKYQLEIAESTRLQEELESITERYKEARAAWQEDPCDEQKTAVYEKLEAVYKRVYNEYSVYVSDHSSSSDSNAFIVKMLGELTLIALQQQYNLSQKQAEEVWDKFVENEGQQGAMEWLVYAGNVWLTADEEESENPFIRKMRQKAEQEASRRVGVAKAKK